jgi:dephospho-CoA kinase
VRIGLTGGIGSGKSTVSAELARLGATIVDADAISRSLTAPSGAAMPALAAAFGPSIVNADGALNRDKMRNCVYSSPALKLQLEAIVHPMVKAEMLRQSALAQSHGARCIVFDIPLLVETAYWKQILHRVLVIDCTEQTQIARVAQRDACSAEQVQRVLRTQASRLQRLQAADMVIFNENLTPQMLAFEVQAIAAQFGL